jgi:esterase FrsA
MSYQWPLNSRELFAERAEQFIALGLPRGDVEAVRGAVTDMWPDAPGGWVYEWSKLAKSYADAGSHLQAAQAYGWAKFPTLADDVKRAALAKQLEEYLLAAPGFEVQFERSVLQLPYQNGTTTLPVHLFTPTDLSTDGPVLIASGGVDGWKMDAHRVFVKLASDLRLRVLAFDIAGTGESAVPMTSAGGGEIVRGLIEHARTLGTGLVAHLGISMGGYYSARSGLAGDVDAAIVWGGPVEAAFDAPPGHFGMDGIIGNAMGFDARPSTDQLFARFRDFSLRPLLDQDLNTPMLIVNGADDVHVPQHDTLVFQGRRDTEVHLLPDAAHCAMTKLPEIMSIIADWLTRALTDARYQSSSLT